MVNPVVRGDDDFDELTALYEESKGAVFWRDDELWERIDRGEKFISLDPSEIDPKDIDGKYGKHRYLGYELPLMSESNEQGSKYPIRRY